ncbi:hypothetical protein AMJ86_00710 [bacterium SM23_57]|nr:MAG: hypothetical protein AMJ86_00710 [bacterium SM23_57]
MINGLKAGSNGSAFFLFLPHPPASSREVIYCLILPLISYIKMRESAGKSILKKVIIIFLPIILS